MMPLDCHAGRFRNRLARFPADPADLRKPAHPDPDPVRIGVHNTPAFARAPFYQFLEAPDEPARPSPQTRFLCPTALQESA
jgi:hypothetical protein